MAKKETHENKQLARFLKKNQQLLYGEQSFKETAWEVRF